MRQNKRWIGVVGDADALGPAVFGVGLGAANANLNETKWFSQELENEKRKPFKSLSRWLKERYILDIN